MLLIISASIPSPAENSIVGLLEEEPADDDCKLRPTVVQRHGKWFEEKVTGVESDTQVFLFPLASCPDWASFWGLLVFWMGFVEPSADPSAFHTWSGVGLKEVMRAIPLFDSSGFGRHAGIMPYPPVLPFNPVHVLVCLFRGVQGCVRVAEGLSKPFSHSLPSWGAPLLVCQSRVQRHKSPRVTVHDPSQSHRVGEG